MVDMSQIEQHLQKHFTVEGTYDIDAHTGEVHVQGNVIAKIHAMDRLPVQFGKVTGKFQLGKQPNLMSLEGSPTYVGGDYYLKGELFTSLKGAPNFVGRVFRASSPQLGSLDHLPTQGSGDYLIMYTPTLPLLRLVLARHVHWGVYVKYGDGGYNAFRIMDKYVGKGKSAVLNCANELKKAGFARNARW